MLNTTHYTITHNKTKQNPRLNNRIVLFSFFTFPLIIAMTDSMWQVSLITIQWMQQPILIVTGCDSPEYLLNMKRFLCDMVATKTHFLQDFTRMDGNALATKPTIVDLIVSVAVAAAAAVTAAHGTTDTKGCLHVSKYMLDNNERETCRVSWSSIHLVAVWQPLASNSMLFNFNAERTALFRAYKYCNKPASLLSIYLKDCLMSYFEQNKPHKFPLWCWVPLMGDYFLLF